MQTYPEFPGASYDAWKTTPPPEEYDEEEHDCAAEACPGCPSCMVCGTHAQGCRYLAETTADEPRGLR